MRIAYLILAHNTPNHMPRLVRALNAPNAEFFIHVDRKSNLSLFKKDLPHSNVTFIDDRVAVYWGGPSIVNATVKLIHSALEHSQSSEYLVLLSGSDYPLRGPRYIEDFLTKHRGRQFINLVRVPCESVGKPIERLEDYWLNTPFNNHVVIRLVAWLNRWNTRLRLITRDYVKVLKDIVPYAGSQWWALTADACRHIVAFIDSRSDVVSYFENVFAADESLFQTIVGNSEFAKCQTRNLTFADWSRPGCKPAILDMDHLNAFAGMGCVIADDPYGRGELLFARKFPDDSAQLTDFVDARIINRENPSGV